MKSWKTRLSVVLAMLAMVLVASVPAVADSVEAECDADDGGVCEENVSVSSYEDEEAVEDLFIEGVDGECSFFDPFCNLEWWPW